MLQRSIYFIVVWFLTSSGEISGQENPQFVEKNLIKSKEIIGKVIDRIIQADNRILMNSQGECQPIALDVVTVTSFGCWGPTGTYVSLSPVSNLHNLSWVCQKEAQLDKITPIKFRLRLGSLDYVNWMEQKPNATRY